MKRPSIVLIVVTIVAIFLGWTIGSFFTGTTVAKAISSIPASPIIVDAKYDKDSHSIDYSILNPGGTEITIIQQSFIFKPGKESKEKGYIVSNVPENLKLPPGVITKLQLRLKKGTEKLKLGDIVLSTFSYIHPLSPDVYTIAHSFEMGKVKTKKKEVSKKWIKKDSSGGESL